MSGNHLQRLFRYQEEKNKRNNGVLMRKLLLMTWKFNCLQVELGLKYGSVDSTQVWAEWVSIGHTNDWQGEFCASLCHQPAVWVQQPFLLAFLWAWRWVTAHPALWGWLRIISTMIKPYAICLMHICSFIANVCAYLAACDIFYHWP